MAGKPPPVVRRRLDADDEMRRWPVPRRSQLLAVLLTLALAAFIGMLVLTLVALTGSDDGHVEGPGWYTWVDQSCEKAPFSCAVLAGAIVLPIPIVIGVLGLLTYRLLVVRRRIQRDARKRAPALVQAAAGTKIVGRDALCAALKRNIEDPETRLPHVLVGGVGVGKTAVLVRLTGVLARHGAVPVPIRLRDAQRPSDLDFGELARKRFSRLVDDAVYSDAEVDKIWRKLRSQDRIVVLADGLEEALIESDDDRAIRDTTIRAAFAQARTSRLPLIVTSRPQPMLRYLSAAELHLEPLSESAALGFIRGQRNVTDPKIRLIVENAEVVEAPLYMQIAQVLDDHGLLVQVDTRCATRLALRLHLLNTWREALVHGDLVQQAPHTAGERQRALDDLGDIALVGLLQDSLQVSFDDLERSDVVDLRGRDYRYSAAVGARLEIVEVNGGGLRFQHSILQAYLGSRRLTAVRDSYLAEAITTGEDPGRELLMSLVMHGWGAEAAPRRREIGKLLREHAAARQPPDAKSIDLMSAAAEIDGMVEARDEPWMETAVKDFWQNAVGEAAGVAKRAAITRLGDLARSRGLPTGAEHLRRRIEGGTDKVAVSPEPVDVDALRALREIAVAADERYAARIAAAQEIGAAGRTAATLFAQDHRADLEKAKTRYRSGGKPNEEERRRLRLQAWTLPMSAGTKARAGEQAAAPDTEGELRALITDWMDLVCGGVDPSVEEAWARGFKFEANRKAAHVDLAMRSFLAEEAERLLEECNFWFTRVALFHAFTLWGLDGGGDTGSATANGTAATSRRDRRRAAERARQIVNGWNVKGREHPFVEQTALLCQEALRTREPGRYIWIDESGIASKVGASTSRPEDIPNSRLWISSAAGWMALDERALKLVGDIIVALNLAEGADSSRREQRLDRIGGATALPPCLTRRSGREALRVTGTANADGPRPGSTCLPGCPAHLCPYPAPGHAPVRGELGEAFCRHQAAAAGGALGHAMNGRNGVPPHELRTFWKQMENRARL